MTFIILFFAPLAVIMVVLRYLFGRYLRLLFRNQSTSELLTIYHWFWDGTPEDELYAWYKVRAVILQRRGRPPRDQLARVDRKIMQLLGNTQQMLGHYSVNGNGYLVRNSHSDLEDRSLLSGR